MSEICETLLKKDFSGAGSGWKARSARTKKKGPRRQDQLVPQKRFSWGSELVPEGKVSSCLKNNCLERVRAGPRRQDQLAQYHNKDFTGAGLELVPEDRISSCLKKKTWGKGPSWSQETGQARTSNKNLLGQGRSWSQKTGSARVSKTLRGRVRADPRRKDQLVPKKRFLRGRGPSWSQKAGLAPA